MGRFHRHDDDTHTHEHSHVLADGTVVTHTHEHSHDDGHHDGHHSHEHEHEHEHSGHDVHEEYGDHSGYQTGAERVSVLEDIFAENDELAEQNRGDLDRNGVKAVNLMSSPGSGKTELLVATLRALQGEARIGIIEGDIETDLDAQRMDGLGAQISVLNTAAGFGGECHLDAPMVAHALERLDLSRLDLLMIENVGNLVCPAEFEVGAHLRAMVYSVTEGEDKPKKYPVMFRAVSCVVVNKIDLLPYLDFDMELFRRNLREVNPDATVIELSAKTGQGVDTWVQWLRENALPGKKTCS
ncbi:hydrogenase nickel incorporation protein HypB [Mobiluncus mulieris]|uniref:hydrogenase nickel incorporation protein HypB n=1 Tax=Mobiluncus mulieris TaxID=2052 RepID=UPI000E071C83|nr:hydrogenase nickel incorporation protein HypB [Mobiluncus mulieris]STY83490.1 Hydrogenase isoenzymes nickel incorporation protein hypB [Mobiluncus mulieris]